MQPKLLRALEDRTVIRLGSVEPIKLDVRVIAASNRDLREMVNRADFRSDLYYRLNIMRVRVPPLRERREDIPLLVNHFYGQLAVQKARPSKDLVAALCRLDWPGNVRELRNAVQRAVLLDDPELWQEISDEAYEMQTSSRVASEGFQFDAAASFGSA